jgi:hypothetical protein
VGNGKALPQKIRSTFISTRMLEADIGVKYEEVCELCIKYLKNYEYVCRQQHVRVM